ncbi:MAG TPA: hypothetical protein VMT51_16100 [Dongiaceae bacterium]|nr:hypothetical protein [Dongiaceae bacterium]
MKRGWTRFWASASACAMLLAPAAAAPQNRSSTPAAPKRNELSLAGLRPGKDRAALAEQLYKKSNARPDGQGGAAGSEMMWSDACRKQTLTVETDAAKRIQTIRVAESQRGGCAVAAATAGAWRTGLGLRVGDTADRVTRLYGRPDSRSPSTKDGQRLELLYYAFDWAGPEVPQVLEVVCTAEASGKPGRVVEITLSASSL